MELNNHPQKQSKAGYEYLITYKQSCEIERLTDRFCEVYLNPFKDRRYIEQMNSSARSMPRNIVEGYTRLGLKDYIEFLSFARASGEELLKDYQRLRDKREIRDRREIGVKRENYFSEKTLPFNPSNPFIPLNYLINLVSRTNYLLDRQISSLEKKFISEGGYTEKLALKRREHRGF